MTFSPIPDGTTNWGFVLNNALNDIQAQISTNLATLSTGDWTSDDNNLIAWTGDVYSASGSSGPTSGVVLLQRVSIKKPSTINNIIYPRSALAVTGVSGQNFAGIYNSNGNLIGQTADLTTQLQTGTAASPQTLALTAQLPVQAGFYWIAYLFNAATTATALRGATGAGSWINSAATSSTLRLATFGSGLTALPSSITPSSMTPNTLLTIMSALN